MRGGLVGTLVAATLLVAVTASAEGLLPRGFKFTYRTLADSTVTKLVFDLEPADVQVGVADSTFTIVDVIRAVWQDGPDHGLEWFFTDSDTLAASSDLLIHGFRRPGLGSVFFAAGVEAPTETSPQVWSPSTLQDGATWSWTGRGLCADYSQDRTESYQAIQESIEVPYRGAWTCFQIQVTEPVVCSLRLPDGRALDAFGRVIAPGDVAKIGEPRWISAVSTGRDDRWSVLLKDGFVELVDVTVDDEPIVPTRSDSVSNLKSRFRR